MTDETARNRAIMQDFVELFFNQLRVREAFEKHAATTYRQHNLAFGDGREATIRDLERQFASMSSPKIEVQRVLVDGNFAAVHLHGRSSPTDPGVAGVDVFRLENGKIVEHWDVVQAIPATIPRGRSVL